LRHSINLTAEHRKTLLAWYRGQHPAALRLRAHIILLLADGLTWATACAVLYCSSRTVALWKARFQEHGPDGLLDRPRGTPRRFGSLWPALVVAWLKGFTPRAFGFLRSRWCCETLALLLWQLHRVDVSRETVRRWLHREDLVWRRPRPVLRREDPQRQARLDKIRALLRHLPDDETAVFEDEVDLELNPAIGCMWMGRGQQAEVVTPGDNDKCYLAGSLHWRTGLLITTVGPKRDAGLFVRHLEDLLGRLRRYKKVHVICDNAKFHTAWLVQEFYARNRDRLEFHPLPRYAPECNPIERVWWRLHEAITRNHTCQDLAELVDLALAWITDKRTFRVKDSVYDRPTTKKAA
jgi:putative transposase